jgi:hypothetical protein
MALFSQRMGFKPMEKVIQKDGMDDALRNGLWTVFCLHIKGKADSSFQNGGLVSYLEIMLARFYFKQVVEKTNRAINWVDVKRYFFTCKWNEVYDFLEFVAGSLPSNFVAPFLAESNQILEMENSAYRFVGNQIVPITDDNEIHAVDEALTSPISAAREKLEQAVTLFGDREAPNYPESVHCSISAVESLCKYITGDEKGTLDSAIKQIDDKVSLHPTFKQALTKLYAYTCDEDGIRHGGVKDSDVDQATAKFMLVTCSAFINYIVAEAATKGIELK